MAVLIFLSFEIQRLIQYLQSRTWCFNYLKHQVYLNGVHKFGLFFTESTPRFHFNYQIFILLIFLILRVLWNRPRIQSASETKILKRQQKYSNYFSEALYTFIITGPIPDTVDNVQHNIRRMNYPLSQIFIESPDTLSLKNGRSI
jgi:hypothetical protein